MRRKTFDAILTAGGAVLVVVLLVAGSLLMWGYSFVSSTVHDELAQQKIFFPPPGSAQLANPEIGPYLRPYAGQQLVTGPQAEAYANHYIAVHLKEIAHGQTYAQVSAAAQQQPNNAQLRAQATTLFQGETLRGLLLEAYGFWELGQMAFYAALASFALAAVMLVLVVLGYLHLRRVSPVEEL